MIAPLERCACCSRWVFRGESHRCPPRFVVHDADYGDEFDEVVYADTAGEAAEVYAHRADIGDGMTLNLIVDGADGSRTRWRIFAALALTLTTTPVQEAR